MSPELRRALATLKERDGIPESEAIRRAIEDFLKRRKIRVAASHKGGTTSTKRR
jgi:predicted transcriptional regulator